MELLSRDARRIIGVIGGSGPEAGADLFVKIIEETKALLGDQYLGDLDGPEVYVASIPDLGLSMELPQNDKIVWPLLENTFTRLAESCDYIAIACNTLNYYETQIKLEPRDAELVSVSDVVSTFLTTNGIKRVAILGSAPVTNMDGWSAYANLKSKFEIELPNDGKELHQIIYDVKRYGGDDPSVMKRFSSILEQLESEIVLLACTELPLIPVHSQTKNLVDVTRLLAQSLVRKTMAKAD